MLVSRLLAQPGPLTACLGMAAAIVVLYKETPPPIWSERCVAWKDAGRDSCKRCCAAYGANYWTPRAVAAACLALLFLRRALSACLRLSSRKENNSPKTSSGLVVVFLGRAACVAVLSAPALLYTPNEYRPAWNGAPLAGLALSAVGHLAGCYRCCCGGGGDAAGAGSSRRACKDAWLELACWGGASMISTCSRRRHFDLAATGDAAAESWLHQVQWALGILACGIVAVVLLLEGRICNRSGDNSDHSKVD